MELEETLMQWKQKTHLLRVLEPVEMQKEAEPMSEREKLIRGIDDLLDLSLISGWCVDIMYPGSSFDRI